MNQQQIRDEFLGLKKQMIKLNVNIVTPSETGCMIIGFKTSDIVRVLDEQARRPAGGLRALQFVSKEIINYKGAGLLDYDGHKILEWIRSNPQYFSCVEEDAYSRLCRDGYVYLNNYNDEMGWFWDGDY